MISEIYESIKHLKIIAVCHSYGAIFTTAMAIAYPKLFTTMIMLDPTIKSPGLLAYLKSLPETDNNNYKINHFDTLPDHLLIPTKGRIFDTKTYYCNYSS